MKFETQRKMNRNNMRIWSVALGVFLFFNPIAPAAVIIFEGTGQANVNIQVDSLIGRNDASYATSPESSFMSVTVDTDALTMTYNKVIVTTGIEAQVNLAGEITTGFGQTSNIQAQIIFDPISVTVNNFGTVPLVSGTGGNFDYAGRSGGAITLRYTGRYSITDGTDQRNGTFDKSINTTFSVNGGELVATNFPASITIGQSGVSSWRVFQFPNNAQLFSETYGTANISFDAYRIALQPNNFMTLSVPEPSVIALFALGLYIAVFRHRSV